MTVTFSEIRNRLAPLRRKAAQEMSHRGIQVGDPASAKGGMRIELEESVNRIVQVYWTPFEVNIPGASLGLHLEIDKPRLHWTEAYISPEPDVTSWILTFHEREIDGEPQLAYYEQHSDPMKAIEAFFNLASWYSLVPTDLTWADVLCEVSEDVGWSPEEQVALGEKEGLDKAIQESLKKSTIIWLRWTTPNGDERTMPVWFIYFQDKIYVLSGERQQTIPGAESLREAHVILRWKMNNAQIAELPADVRALQLGEGWDTIAERIAEKRLNIPGLPEETARRWRDECVILEISLR
ncbi:MAG: hypothetical protein ACRDLB_01050 [Actinomycetota bacterium]